MNNLKLSRLTVNIIILILIISKVTSIIVDDTDIVSKESEVTYYRQNGLNRFLTLVNSLTANELTVLIEKKKYIFSSYLEPESQLDSLNGDFFLQKEKILKESYKNYEKVCHIPIETKSLAFFSKHSHKEPMTDSEVQSYFFPRIKHYKKILPELTPEPYQRIMGFAIEVCMLPSIWHLELVHCMFTAISPYFDGMLMSYSLQDLVGSAIISMDYKNEQFSLENCIKYLPLFSDNKISTLYIRICRETESCLKSRSFYTNNFANFKNEFNHRIQEVYRAIPPLDDALNPKVFARYLILYSLSIFLKKIPLNKNFPERNFLPIRVMAASVGYYALVKKMKMSFLSESHLVGFFTKLISNLLFEKTDEVIERCSREIMKFSDINNDHLFELFKAFCKEIFSVGFINESLQNLGEINSILINSTHSNRILLNSYSFTVPEMSRELPLSEYNNSWINFKNFTENYLEYNRKSGKDGRLYNPNSELPRNLNQIPISKDKSNAVEQGKHFSKRKKTRLCFGSSKKKVSKRIAKK
ncbi:uncharacterized protein ELE39_000107 [Cryptosporidium sp. chipmunk genotype I]|uniref:uncharacterized protein n=1 Tax=Cryptosporidium sp. chipmunk genotype I TaxID=1280935 RepID=UPI00351A0170|nr:hypothetical protein ELE39_000107 [Cryptosporidium sp. chipmunk genotype I]